MMTSLVGLGLRTSPGNKTFNILCFLSMTLLNDKVCERHFNSP